MTALNDFKLLSSWEPDSTGEKWRSRPNIPKYLIDSATGNKYLNEDRSVVRVKCFLLSLATPFVHSVAAVCKAAYLALKIISLSHLWIEKEGFDSSLQNRVSTLAKDVCKLIASPFVVIGLELAAIYGIMSPYNGRKVYASLERFEYGTFLLAPCFQPNPQSHAFGGNINTQNAF